MGVNASGQSAGVSQESATLGVEEEEESRWSKMGQELNHISIQSFQRKPEVEGALRKSQDQSTQLRNTMYLCNSM
jgi:hypothetical protein